MKGGWYVYETKSPVESILESHSIRSDRILFKSWCMIAFGSLDVVVRSNLPVGFGRMSVGFRPSKSVTDSSSGCSSDRVGLVTFYKIRSDSFRMILPERANRFPVKHFLRLGVIYFWNASPTKPLRNAFQTKF